MYRLICTIVVLIVVIENVHQSAGYKWVRLNPWDRIPAKAVRLSERRSTYVGRARHYDELLPAEIFNSTTAVVLSCSKEFVKHHFEVLVATENCIWKEFQYIEEIPDNIVRGGSKSNGEPIYIGYSINPSQGARILSVLFGSRQIIKWPGATEPSQALLCENQDNWIDSSAGSLPSNTIYGGKSNGGNDIFVARLKKDCDIIPGQVTPELGIATAIYGWNHFNSSYCQVLVGEPSRYTWEAASDGEIPDYAVAAARTQYSELMYVARVNETLGYIVPSEAVQSGMTYDILIRTPE